MKAKELMIGDWVKCLKTPHTEKEFYAIVDEIYSDSIFTASDYYEGCQFNEDEIEPIPITPEILEMNGWHELPWEDVKYYPGIDKQYKNDYFTDTLRISYRESVHSYNILDDEVRVNNVHELQHVMNMLFGRGDYEQKILI